MNSDKIVSFGKYKGQPLSALINDKSYFKWCQQQSWFQEKFPKLCDTSMVEEAPVTIIKRPKPMVVQATVKPSAAPCQPSGPSGPSGPVSEKIRQLEDENKTLLQKINHNKLEIQRLRSQMDNNQEIGDNDTDDDEQPQKAVKKAGKCLL